MQTGDAAVRRKNVESRNLAKVIYGYEHDDCVCVQYHPKGIAGGMMPEFDSRKVSPTNPTPLESTYSPWHACGPDYERYSAGVTGQPEGLDSITIEVTGKERYDRMLDLAKQDGIYDDGCVIMLGVKWYFVLKEGGGESTRSKL
ncbi:hypothetical protein LTR70_001298 [Exophiala xenobiotica]|uniref:Uncharacterized protein n=1 Tax=Lithohypha guttulata TaxID=1690604 RepID=A0ABR0KMJ1_9EURO|nr:hypothetical protein LTR24_000947 [Lithohypha guttulata]KAK5327977.1 hypothetical protein LTR70_001298 [Exophiala xenobiotica]